MRSTFGLGQRLQVHQLGEKARQRRCELSFFDLKPVGSGGGQLAPNNRRRPIHPPPLERRPGVGSSITSSFAAAASAAAAPVAAGRHTRVMSKVVVRGGGKLKKGRTKGRHKRGEENCQRRARVSF